MSDKEPSASKKVMSKVPGRRWSGHAWVIERSHGQGHNGPYTCGSTLLHNAIRRLRHCIDTEIPNLQAELAELKAKLPKYWPKDVVWVGRGWVIKMPIESILLDDKGVWWYQCGCWKWEEKDLYSTKESAQAEVDDNEVCTECVERRIHPKEGCCIDYTPSANGCQYFKARATPEAAQAAIDGRNEERPVDTIRKMNPGKHIPTGQELADRLNRKGADQ